MLRDEDILYIRDIAYLPQDEFNRRLKSAGLFAGQASAQADAEVQRLQREVAQLRDRVAALEKK